MDKKELKKAIELLMEDGRKLRGFIRAASGMTRWRLWEEKRAVGRGARQHLLAYGFLRGVKYRRIEPRQRFIPAPETIACLLGGEDRTLDVQAWLLEEQAGPVVELPQAVSP
jgi:hypothetical protein